VVLRDLMWEVFQSTGHIEAYLMYRSCTECKDLLVHSLAQQEEIDPLN